MTRYTQRRAVNPEAYPIINEHWSTFWFEKQSKQCQPLEYGLRDCMLHQRTWPLMPGNLTDQCNRVLDAMSWNTETNRPSATVAMTTTNSVTTTVTGTVNKGMEQSGMSQQERQPSSPPTPVVHLTHLTAIITTMNLVCLFSGVLVGLGGYGCYVWVMYTFIIPTKTNTGYYDDIPEGSYDESASGMWAERGYIRHSFSSLPPPMSNY